VASSSGLGHTCALHPTCVSYILLGKHPNLSLELSVCVCLYILSLELSVCVCLYIYIYIYIYMYIYVYGTINTKVEPQYLLKSNESMLFEHIYIVIF
jgi:hypothetical protein